MQILSVGLGLPPNHYDQETLLEALKVHWGQRHFNTDRLERLHRNVLVGGRRLALPIEEYDALDSFGKANKAWIRAAEAIGADAVADALDRAGLSKEDVDAFFFVTVTGVATPSIDAKIINRMGLPQDVRRTPIFGLGCVAGAAGIARAADYVHAYPDRVAVLLSVELCSLTLQREDLSVANLIASGLFGDGAAAAVVAGAERAARHDGNGAGGESPLPATGPRVVASRSRFYPETEDVMGWDITERGFGIILSADVPKMVEENLGGDVDRFLADHGLSRKDIKSWVCHPGGPKVLTAMESTFELSEGALDVTWRHLAEVGNLSSTSVLMVLHETMKNHRPEPGSPGLLLAMGPGFCSELVLLEW